MPNSPSDIVPFFAVPGAFLGSESFGSGLINDTYLCRFEAGGEVRKYILQRINTGVFRQPEHVMENIAAVTAHIMKRLKAGGIADPSAVTPALVLTRDGSSFRSDGAGGFWRMFHFIEHGEVFDTIQDSRHAYQVGRGLGMFQELVSDLPADRLHDTLPGFHHTPRYLTEYDEAMRLDPKGRVHDVQAEIAFVDGRRGLAPILTRAMDSGILPVRIVHNDPKVNNIMIDRKTGTALCMLDLDTVKPGIVHFDFGDCVRSAANPAGEDADLTAVRFDQSLFEAVAEGYLAEASAFLTRQEIGLLPASIQVVTFELGLRFLADHLRGDTYFKTNYPGHNLHRARVQFKLLESIRQTEQEITSFIEQHARRQ
jgi:Ser/Thr protein kinase RdoA (MazF antagonist)